MRTSKNLFTRPAAVFSLLAGLTLLPGGAAYGQTPDAGADEAPNQAGTVEFVSGDSMITPKVGDSRLAAKGGRVNEGDTIITFNGSEAQLRMLDGAYLMVRANSRIKIQAYVADGGKDDRSILDLIKGTVRSITGWIGKYNRTAYEIRTPILVTIGVRGTDHEVTYIPPDDPRGKPGVYDKVNEGEVVMRSGGNVVAVPPNRAVFSAWGATPHRPRLLASIPGFFRAGPHEREFARQARASMRTLGAQRQARIRAVQALRARRRGATRGVPQRPGLRPGLRPGARAPGAAVRERPARAGALGERAGRGATVRDLRGGGGLLRPRGALRERDDLRERGGMRGERAGGGRFRPREGGRR
jgi:hypothetical protein